jgi:transposase
MGCAYSLDLRSRIIQAVEEGMPKKVIAKIFKISMQTINRYINRLKATGTLAPKVRVCAPARISEEDFGAYIAEHPDATLSELSIITGISRSAVYRLLVKYTITRKKKRKLILKETKRSDKNL